MKKLFLIIVSILFIAPIFAQNIAITDDNSYTADPSAMLDVKSFTKGMLVPRMTTTQITAIASPATGLLVYDTNFNAFYYYDGSNWINLTSGSSSGLLWSYNSPYLYTTNTSSYIGVGTSSPTSKLSIKDVVNVIDGTTGSFIDIENSLATDGVMTGIRLKTNSGVDRFKAGIFYRRSTNYGRGDVIIANNSVADLSNVTAADARLVVQNDGRVMVKGDPNSGLDDAIFAVQNQNGDTVFAVYNEGVRIWVDDNGGTKANGNRGGFAVGGYSPTKAGFTNEYLRVTPDSVRVYIDDDYVAAKATGSRGGFAVGGFNPTKGTNSDHYLFVQDDSTRVRTNGNGGFEIQDLASGSTNYLDLTPENYFIGHESGISTTSGLYNSFLGYQSGLSNTTGNKNYFIGYRSGYNNIGGSRNIFIGDNAGFSNTTGTENIFIGNLSGSSNIIGNYNVFLGYNAGLNNDTSYNVFIGYEAGKLNTKGTFNVANGYTALQYNTTGSYNVAIGWGALRANTTGDNNTASGNQALLRNTIGDWNVATGNSTLAYNTTGILNTGNGMSALYNNISGNYNTATGGWALLNNKTGSNNTAFGYCAGYGTNGGLNTSNCTFIGANSYVTVTRTNVTMLGYAVGNAQCTGNNQVLLGNTAITQIRANVNSITAYSDARYKTNVKEDVAGLDFILKLKPVTYNVSPTELHKIWGTPDSTLAMIDHSEIENIKYIGFLAQDVEQAANECGFDFPGIDIPKNDNEVYSLRYSDFIMPMVKGMQELSEENQQLKEQVKELLERIERIENK